MGFFSPALNMGAHKRIRQNSRAAMSCRDYRPALAPAPVPCTYMYLLRSKLSKCNYVITVFLNWHTKTCEGAAQRMRPPPALLNALPGSLVIPRGADNMSCDQLKTEC